MMNFLPVLLVVLLFFPFVARAGFLDVLGDILQYILCIITGIACPDPCLQLGPAASRLCHMVDNIGGALYVIGWGLALVVILVGGIAYMTSAGEEDKITKAKKIITSGLIGAAIILCSGFILSILVEFLAPLFLP